MTHGSEKYGFRWLALLCAAAGILGILLSGCRHPTNGGGTTRYTITTYTITFDSHGGSAVTAITADTGTSVAKPADPTRAGYIFTGWFIAETGGTLYTWPHTLTGNVAMHARWTATTYTISYNLNGGTNNGTNPASYTIESPAVTLAVPTYTGYTFGGWYDNNSFTGSAVTTIPAGGTGAKTFHARWLPGASVQIILQAVPSDPPLTSTTIFEDGAAVFNTGAGYSSYMWYWDGGVISGADSASYTLGANSKAAGVYELLVIVTTSTGEALSARCRVTIRAR
jgi:uncharacterized repeat protein (TIGR02543 family)